MIIFLKLLDTYTRYNLNFIILSYFKNGFEEDHWSYKDSIFFYLTLRVQAKIKHKHIYDKGWKTKHFKSKAKNNT